MSIFGDALERSYIVADCTVEPALGRSERLIKCPDGALLETTDLAAVAALEQAYKLNRPLRLIHKLESAWKFVALSAVGMMVFVWAFTVYALPMLATRAAYATPLGVTKTVSERTLQLLDAQYLQASELALERQAVLEQDFTDVADDLSELTYRLEFRAGGVLGANAFALPSGIIILTDELVSLADTDDEILAVLAHEIGHVEKRHGLRSAYQSTGVFILVSALLGDVTSATSLTASLPAVLLESGYSRAFEREADRVAKDYLLAQHGDAESLASILEKLESQHGGSGNMGFLSSHPGTNERVADLRETP